MAADQTTTYWLHWVKAILLTTLAKAGQRRAAKIRAILFIQTREEANEGAGRVGRFIRQTAAECFAGWLGPSSRFEFSHRALANACEPRTP